MTVSTDSEGEMDPSSVGHVESSPGDELSTPQTDEASRRLGRWFTADVVIPMAAIFVVIILVAGGLSGSSLPLLSSDGSWDASLVEGEPRPIRSDEYVAWSPIKIGQAQADFPDSRIFGMGEIDTGDSWRHHIPSASVGHLLFSPFNAPLIILPVEQGFAGYWWGPFLAAFLGAYAWFRLLGGRWQIAFPAALLVVAAPAAAWWSGWQLQGLAHATAACAVVMAATRLMERRRVLAIAMAIGAALVAAGLPWFYQPWAIVAALFVGVVTMLWGMSVADRRRNFLIVAAVAVTVFVIESMIYLIHERAYYEALADTLYPGARRFTGGGLEIGFLFSSFFAATVNGVDGSRIAGTNLSEFSSGWTLTLVVAVGLAIAGRNALRRDPERFLVVGTILVSLAISSWSVVNWGFLARLQPLTLVAPERVAPFIGFFGITCLVLLTGPADRWRELLGAMDKEARVLVGVSALAVTLWAISDGRRLYLPTAGGLTVLLVITTVIVLLALLLRGHAAASLGLTAIIALLITSQVNPLTKGIGALKNSEAAQTVRAVDVDVGGQGSAIWAADDLLLVPLLNGVGVDSLSSFNDPVDQEGWRRLDPDGEYEQQWNRFAYVLFRWEPGLPSPIIESPQPDVVVVRVDPCDPALDRVRLDLIVSSAALDQSCLTDVGSFPWQGIERSIYLREDQS